MVDHLIMEVDEELRREKRLNFWRDFGTYIVTISVVILLGTAALVGWQNYVKGQREEWTSVLLAAMEHIENKEFEEAYSILQPLSTDADENFKDIADIWLSQIAIETGKLDDAKKILLAIISDGDSEYLSLAKILLVEHDLQDITQVAAANGDEKASSSGNGDDASAVMLSDSSSLLLREFVALSKLNSDDMAKRKEAIEELRSIADNVLTKRSARERINMILSRVSE